MLRSLRLPAALLLLVAFTIVSRQASAEAGGFIALWKLCFRDISHFQILFDLMIACLFALFWMLGDARKRKATVWPYVLITIPLGSFGPLLYLVVREWTLLRQPPSEQPEKGAHD